MFLEQRSSGSFLCLPNELMSYIDFQVRIFVDMNIDSQLPFGNARWRVKVNSTYSPIGDKKEWIHRSFKQQLTTLLNANWGSWTPRGNESVNWVDASSDSFLQSSGMYYLIEWDILTVTVDMDVDSTLDYEYYRQRLEIFYIDETVNML